MGYLDLEARFFGFEFDKNKLPLHLLAKERLTDEFLAKDFDVEEVERLSAKTQDRRK